MSKPPLGIMPRKFHDEKRMQDLANAINRRLQEPSNIPIDWIEEYNELVIRFNTYTVNLEDC